MICYLRAKVLDPSGCGQGEIRVIKSGFHLLWSGENRREIVLSRPKKRGVETPLCSVLHELVTKN